MRSVEDFVEQLRARYKGTLPFKRICQDEQIIVTKAKLDEDINGFYISGNGLRLIILSESIPYEERRDWAFHELWHHFKSVAEGINDNYHSTRKDEYRANLFAALCRAPYVRDGDTISSLRERYSISGELAKVRIEYELKRLNQ